MPQLFSAVRRHGQFDASQSKKARHIYLPTTQAKRKSITGVRRKQTKKSFLHKFSEISDTFSSLPSDTQAFEETPRAGDIHSMQSLSPVAPWFHGLKDDLPHQRMWNISCIGKLLSQAQTG